MRVNVVLYNMTALFFSFVLTYISVQINIDIQLNLQMSHVNVCFFSRQLSYFCNRFIYFFIISSRNYRQIDGVLRKLMM